MRGVHRCYPESVGHLDLLDPVSKAMNTKMYFWLMVAYFAFFLSAVASAVPHGVMDVRCV